MSGNTATKPPAFITMGLINTILSDEVVSLRLQLGKAQALLVEVVSSPGNIQLPVDLVYRTAETLMDQGIIRMVIEEDSQNDQIVIEFA